MHIPIQLTIKLRTSRSFIYKAVDLLVCPKGAQYLSPAAPPSSFPLVLIKQLVKKAIETAKRDSYIGLLRVLS
jgi:hypothetical protein